MEEKVGNSNYIGLVISLFDNIQVRMILERTMIAWM